jgi:hypothetical protein
MQWVMIMALWTTTPPQEDFTFYTEAFQSRQECLVAVQAYYAAALEKGIQVQGICASKAQLGFDKEYVAR